MYKSKRVCPPYFQYVYFMFSELENSLCISVQVSTVPTFYWRGSFKIFPWQTDIIFLPGLNMDLYIPPMQGCFITGNLHMIYLDVTASEFTYLQVHISNVCSFIWKTLSGPLWYATYCSWCWGYRENNTDKTSAFLGPPICSSCCHHPILSKGYECWHGPGLTLFLQHKVWGSSLPDCICLSTCRPSHQILEILSSS